MRLLMDQGPERGYFPEPAKSLFIADNLEMKEAARRKFKQVDSNLNYIGGIRYLGA